MAVDGRRIAVVGAGIGGLAAALALTQRGAEVTVLERAPEVAGLGAGLQISPNGLRVLSALGLAEGLGNAPAARAVVLRDAASGQEVLRLDLDATGRAGAYRFVHRGDLIDLLVRRVRAAGVRLKLLQKVRKVAPGARPQLYLANGDACEADLVIGADGLHSAVRGALNDAQPPRFTGQVAWRAVVPNLTDHPAEAQIHMAPGRHLVSYPLRDGRSVNLVAVEERRQWVAEGWHHADTAEALQRAFSGFGGDASRLLGAVQAPNLWGLFRHPVAARWGGGNVALLGDAAHPSLPFLAQGANLALEDAWVLAAELDRHAEPTAALAAYQARRRPRAVRVVRAASGNAWKYHLRPPFRAPAHLLLRLAGTLAPERMMAQFDWLYDHDVTAA